MQENESLRNVTIRKNKWNSKFDTQHIISFNTATVSPTFPSHYYKGHGPRSDDGSNEKRNISPQTTRKLQISPSSYPAVNDYNDVNEILPRESGERSVSSSSKKSVNLHSLQGQISNPVKTRTCKTLRDFISNLEENLNTDNNVLKKNNDYQFLYQRCTRSNLNKQKRQERANKSLSLVHKSINISPTNKERKSDSSETNFDPSECIYDDSAESSSDHSYKFHITYRNRTKCTDFNLPKTPFKEKSLSDIFSSTTIIESNNNDKDENKKNEHIDIPDNVQLLESINTKLKNTKTRKLKTKSKRPLRKCNRNNTKEIEKSITYSLRSRRQLTDDQNIVSATNDLVINVDSLSKIDTESIVVNNENNNDKNPVIISEEIILSGEEMSPEMIPRNVNERIEYAEIHNEDSNKSQSSKANKNEKNLSNEEVDENIKRATQEVFVLLDRCDINVSQNRTDNNSKICKNQSVQTQLHESEDVLKSVCRTCRKKEITASERQNGLNCSDFIDNVSTLSGIKKLTRITNQFETSTSKKIPKVCKLMKDVVAFVDIKLDGSDKSLSVVKILNSLGAEISRSLTRSVTHIVFYEGSVSTVEKSKKWCIPIVSFKWVMACKHSGQLLSSDDFPPIRIENYYQTIQEDRDELFKTVLRTVVKDLEHFTSSDLSEEDIEVPLSILMLRKYLPPYQEDSQHIYDLKSIEISLGLNYKKRQILRRLLFPHRQFPDSDLTEPSDNSFSPVQLTPRCSAPARLFTKDRSKKKKTVQKSLQFGDEIEKIRSMLNEDTVKCDTGKKKMPDEESEQEQSSDWGTQRIQNFCPRMLPPSHLRDDDYQKRMTPQLFKKINFRRSSLPNKNKTPLNLDKQHPIGISRSAKQQRPTGTLHSPKEMLIPPNKINQKGLPKQQALKSCLKRKIGMGRKRLYSEESLQIELQDVDIPEPSKTPRRNVKTNHKTKSKSTKKKTERLLSDDKFSSIYETTDSSRSSSYWFMSDNNDPSKKRKRNVVKPVIVCTGLNGKDIKVFNQYISELGHFMVHAKVTERTTHVVADGSKRTMNLLKGIVRGCWILKDEWVRSSFETGKWLNESQFELKHISPAVYRCRTEKQAFGNLYAFDLLSKFGSFYVSNNSKIPRNDLYELISLSGGKITTRMQIADVILGEIVRGKTCVKETWVLDCISKCSELNLNEYLLDETS